MLKAYRSLKDIQKDFPDNESCLDFLEAVRWKNGIRSPFTNSTAVTRVSERLFLCKETNKRFTVTTNTIFSGTKSGLTNRFKIIWLLAIDPALSTLTIAGRTGLNQKTVWNFKQKLDLAKNAHETQTGVNHGSI
jgi:hypothetical protein